MFNTLITAPIGRLLNRPQAASQERDTTTLNARSTLQFALTQPGDSPQRPPMSEMRSAHVAARRPLASIGGVLAGFEFCVDSPQRARMRFDNTTARESTLSVLRAMRPSIDAHLIALAELPASWLGLCLNDGVFLRGMYLVLGPDALFDDSHALAALIGTLRDLGVMLGWRVPANSSAPMPPGRPDFVAVTAAARGNADSWRQAIGDGLRRWPDVPQVLLDMASVELLDTTFAPPVALAACTVGVCEEPAQCVPLSATTERLLRLLGEVAQDRSGKRLQALLKTDEVLAQLLLQGFNAQSSATGRSFTSAERALSAVGRESVHRHIARMLVQQAPQRAATITLRQHALARARMTELLAITAGEAEPVALYLTGLGSMLPTLLRCTVDDALAPLRLPPDAITALAEQAGRWMHYATLIRALERHDMVAAEGLAMPFGGLQAVLALSTESWRSPV